MNIIYYGHSIAQEKIYLNRGDKVRISLLKKTDSAPDTSFSSRWKRLNTSKYEYVIGNIEDLQIRNIIIIRNKDKSLLSIPKNTIFKIEKNKINKSAVTKGTIGGFVCGTFVGMIILGRGLGSNLPLSSLPSFSNHNADQNLNDWNTLRKLISKGAVLGGIPGAIVGYIIGAKMQYAWQEVPLNRIQMSRKISFPFSFSFN